MNRATRERYLVRFVAMFARSIWPFYGGALNELGRFPVSPDLDGPAAPAQAALGRRRSASSCATPPDGGTPRRTSPTRAPA